jgi:hypothetical protein
MTTLITSFFLLTFFCFVLPPWAIGFKLMSDVYNPRMI